MTTDAIDRRAHPPVLLPVTVLVVLALAVGVSSFLVEPSSGQRGLFALASSSALAAATGYLALRLVRRRRGFGLVLIVVTPALVFGAANLMLVPERAPGASSVVAVTPPTTPPTPGRQTLKEAHGALEAGAPARARALFHEAAAQLAPDERVSRVEAFTGIGDAALRLSDQEAARLAYGQALALAGDDSTRARLQAELGNVESLAGNWSAASEHFDRAVALYEAGDDRVGHANVLLRRGELLAREKKLEAARESLEAAARTYGEAKAPVGRANALLGLAELDIAADEAQRASSRLQEAGAIYTKAANLRGQASVERLTGTLEARVGKAQDAQEALERARDLYARAGDEQAVAQVVQQVAVVEADEADPPPPRRDNTAARRLWRQGYEHYNAGRIEEAQAKYRAAIAKDPTYAPPYNSLGRILMDSATDQGWREAEKLIKTSLRHRPTYMAAVNNLGVLELERKNYDAAIALFLRALRLKPGHRLPLGNLARAYLRSGNYEDAMRVAKQLAKTDPDAARAIERSVDRAVRVQKPLYPKKAKSIRDSVTLGK